jgi:hypothetical protein
VGRGVEVGEGRRRRKGFEGKRIKNLDEVSRFFYAHMEARIGLFYLIGFYRMRYHS